MLQEGQAQFIFYFQAEGDVEPMLCTLGYDPTTGDYPFPDTVEAHYAYDKFEDCVTPLMSEDYNLTKCVMQLIVPGGSIEAEWAETSTGTVSSDAVPQNTAYLFRKVTGGVGRGKNGRMYLPGVPEAKVSGDGTLDTAWVDSTNDQLSTFYTMWDTGAHPRIVVNHGPTNPGFTDAIDTIICDPVVATQRRRLRR